MPYASTSELPAYVKKYSAKLQRMWMGVFNSAYDKALKEGKSVQEAEAAAFSTASGVVKKNMEKFGIGHYEHSDMILYLVDKFESKI
jgi:cation transport regulator ChaB